MEVMIVRLYLEAIATIVASIVYLICLKKKKKVVAMGESGT